MKYAAARVELESLSGRLQAPLPADGTDRASNSLYSTYMLLCEDIELAMPHVKPTKAKQAGINKSIYRGSLPRSLFSAIEPC